MARYVFTPARKAALDRSRKKRRAGSARARTTRIRSGPRIKGVSKSQVRLARGALRKSRAQRTPAERRAFRAIRSSLRKGAAKRTKTSRARRTGRRTGRRYR